MGAVGQSLARHRLKQSGAAVAAGIAVIISGAVVWTSALIGLVGNADSVLHQGLSGELERGPVEAPVVLAVPAAPAVPTGSPSATPEPMLTQAPSVPATRLHLIMPGDTLAELSGETGVPLDILMQLNGIGDPDLIYSGATLVLIPVD